MSFNPKKAVELHQAVEAAKDTVTVIQETVNDIKASGLKGKLAVHIEEKLKIVSATVDKIRKTAENSAGVIGGEGGAYAAKRMRSEQRKEKRAQSQIEPTPLQNISNFIVTPTEKRRKSQRLCASTDKKRHAESAESGSDKVHLPRPSNGHQYTSMEAAEILSSAKKIAPVIKEMISKGLVPVKKSQLYEAVTKFQAGEPLR